MSLTIENTEKIYIDSENENAVKQLEALFRNRLREQDNSYEEIIFLCIGTDRATGDCLGPLVGYKLKSVLGDRKNAFVYGTLESPIHAKNLSESVERIYKRHEKPLVVAIDASLGDASQVGYMSVKRGSLKPGAGLNKRLPAIGDISIVGIVNYCGIMEMMILQSTRLNVVMKMADIIVTSIEKGLSD